MSAKIAAGDFGRIDKGPLAQLVEQETLNLLVVGSIPTRPTNSLCKDETGPCNTNQPSMTRKNDVHGVAIA
jgi:hypothetical protein